MSTTHTPSLAPRALRRRSVAIGALGLLLTFAALFLQATGLAGWPGQALSVIGIIVMVFGWARLIFPPYAGMPQMDNPQLDERQRTVVTQAYATAYRILVAGLMAAVVYVILSDLFSGLPKLASVTDKGLLAVALMWTVIGLPAAVLAWNEPDAAD